MTVAEDLADALAKDTIEAAEAMGDDRLIEEVSKQLGASSQTTQEAFMTAVRVRLAEKRARGFLQDKLKGFLADQKESGQKAQKG
ncbi:hypothetical protein [Thalassobius sp. Cn5-15]|jgi:Fe-S cluster biosynthesis and repair protein YggX|uniref:hypothetical protein n=1 Tax=Thalassobius sp. Cn5-15 TaxID=2917763 RepID=UPI001EF36903|nr:hypothetical protein [Thalassobius sp. Cn5-15]MCG7492195.1 hypothetical protein [Thalassobius sp. Cn5-15]